VSGNIEKGSDVFRSTTSAISSQPASDVFLWEAPILNNCGAGRARSRSGATVHRIQCKAGDEVLTQAGLVRLENGRTREQKLEFTSPPAGDDQEILLLLEREGKPSPYRSLRLWFNVKLSARPVS
jgi:hypothetical protein